MRFIFDLDNTLFGPADPIYKTVGARIKEHLCLLTGIAPETYEIRRAELEQKYGTEYPLIPFCNEYGLDYDTVLTETFLAFDPAQMPIALRQGAENLALLSGERIVLSNAPIQYVEKMLAYFSLRSTFSSIHASLPQQLINKKLASAFVKLMSDIPTVIIDDKAENLLVPHDIGWKTVWFPLGEVSETPAHVDQVITSLDELT